ncbi:Dot/Icm system substrate protein LidA [Legionella lansingensis]|uniref:Dot/Icm system substrate protein LidA n=1 Tax=Legionella lansingensis TaxID=45067 RepID=A0A0W0VXQ3_9GAMM|nr:hypothetical protein [Legionella lansingensis]KTD24810.1 Dot/Icm system substrate protein LidA [Legionella lansingensis]SNV49043.1 Dot/Icm system substrate protein LidA [Legionella lansingensis]
MANTPKRDHQDVLTRGIPEERTLEKQDVDSFALTTKNKEGVFTHSKREERSLEKQDVDSITLTTKNKEEITLTSSQLEQWFANLEARKLEHPKSKHAHKSSTPEPHSHDLATQYLSRYGLKTAKDVITFLKSPAGHAIIALIGEKLAEIASINKAIRQELLDHETRKHRALAALLLGLLYRKEAQARARHEAEEKQSKKLHDAQKQSQTSSGQSSAEAAKAYAAYRESIVALEDVLKEKVKASEELEQEMDKLEKQGQAINSRYANFDHSLALLDQFTFLMQPDAMDPQQRVNFLNSLQNEIDSLRAEAQKITEPGPDNEETLKHLLTRIDMLKEQHDFLQSNLDKPPTELLQQRIDGLIKKLEGQAELIGKLIEANNDEQALRLLHEHNAMHVQVEGLRDMLAVMKGEKVLYNDEGQVTSDFTKAAFVLPKEEQGKNLPKEEQGKKLSIVHKNGKYYLLRGHDPKDFESLPEEVKTAAQKNFERARPDIANLKKLVEHNKTLEGKEHKSKKETLTQHTEDMQKDILLITNQILQLQAAQANVSTLMKQTPQVSGIESTTTSPKLTPMPTQGLSKGSSSKPSSDTSAIVKSCKHVLLLMKNNPTPESINLLGNMFKGPDGRIDSPTQEVLASIRVGRPIPQQTMNFLLKNMERLGLDAYRPNVSSIPDPLRQEPSSTAPTPFKTKPY